MTFGAYLTELRNSRKIAKNAFAKAIGVPFSTVNNWELHGSAPNQANMSKLIKELKLTPTEKTKLTELWLAMPRGESEAPESPPPSSAPTSLGRQPAAEPSGAAETALAALLTRALVPGRHTMFDAVAVFRALSEAAALVEDLGVAETPARAWLDAAASLRERGARVTAASLLAVVVAHEKNDRETS